LVVWARNALGASPNAKQPARSRERMKKWGVIKR
jgi:hypothetical protein